MNEIDKVLELLKNNGTMSKRNLQRSSHLGAEELDEILSRLEQTGAIKLEVATNRGPASTLVSLNESLPVTDLGSDSKDSVTVSAEPPAAATITETQFLLNPGLPGSIRVKISKEILQAAGFHGGMQVEISARVVVVSTLARIVLVRSWLVSSRS